MKYDPNKHHRRSIRLKGYDYTQAGAYFVTICTQYRACLFGEILDGAMQLNDAGQMVETWWAELTHKFPSVETDEYIVMPNHFHGIIVIVGADLCVCPDQYIDPNRSVCPYPDQPKGAHTGAPLPQFVELPNEGAHTGAPLPQFVQWFKTMTTNEYIRGVKQKGWAPFSKKLWQRNYYEHIIRNEESFQRIRKYIINNPLSWEKDQLHPHNPSKS